MLSAEQQEMLGYVEQLITMTQGGRLQWERPNPSSYGWTSRSRAGAPTGVEVIQRLESARGPVFVLQVVDPQKPQQPRVSLESTADQSIAEKLKELYDSIGTHIARGNLDFFRSILPKPE